MINLTNEPMLIDPDVRPADLNVAIRRAIEYTVAKEAEHYGHPGGSPILRTYYGAPTFAFYFTDELKGTELYTKDFIQAAFELCKINQLRDSKSSLAINSLCPSKTGEYPLIQVALLRSGLKTVLIHLWCQRVLMLPLIFHSERSIKGSVYKELLTEVAALFWNYDRSKVVKPQNHPTLGSWSDSEFEKAHRIVWATDWHSFGEVTVEEVSEFHGEVLKSVGTGKFPNTSWPFVSMLSELLNQQGDKMSFSVEKVKLYEKWIYGWYYKQYTYEEFCSSLTAIKEAQKKSYQLTKIKAKRKRVILKRERMENLTGVDLSRPRLHTLLEQIASQNNHEAAVDYYSKISGLKRGYASNALYPGRAHVDVAVLGSFWKRTFNGLLKFRETQGYEDAHEPKATLTLLCDYLFLYLPWWSELNPQIEFKFPFSPADFNRFDFLVPNEKSIEESPLPFFEITKHRRKTINAWGGVVSDLNYYFDYLIGHQKLYPELAGTTLTNPVVLKLDFPRGKTGHSKTTHIPFPKRVFPYLLRFLYAVEKFGIHLQDLVVQGELTLTLHNQPTTYLPKDYNYNLDFDFNEQTYLIHEVPNLFSIVKRTIRSSRGEILNVFIPHLSALRMLIVALETGLRVQSVQWLDRLTWDALNFGKPQNSYIYPLVVNTDKTRDKPWLAPIVYRARDVLLREQRFQESIEEEGMDDLMPYENRPNSRFTDLVPLFRTGGYKGRPINDTWYHAIWRDMLIGFQNFWNEEVSTDSFTQFLEIKPKWSRGIEQEGNEVIEYDETGVAYCPLRYAPIYTPHAARVTFVSSRSGIIDIEDTRKAVGHQNWRVTSYYTVVEFEQLAANLEAADQELWDYDHDNPAYVRADLENSALRRSMNKDPVGTAKQFGFISISLVNEKEEDAQDCVERLRAAGMDQMVFRETHICPVGEICPDNIRDLIYEPRRCGLCPLAFKSVDHIPAIAAKMSQLLEQIQTADGLLKRLKARGEPEAVLNEINERRRIDASEYMGWHLALQVLNEILEKMKDGAPSLYHIEEPEMVKRHLKLVCKPGSKVEFILSRIDDTVAFPNMETPELRAKANRLRQQLLANAGRVEEALQQVPDGDEVTTFLSSLRTVMDALGLSRQDLLDSNLLESNRGLPSAEKHLQLSP